MAAIEVAKRPDSTKISHDLMPVKKGYPGEEWTKINGKDMVLLVTGMAPVFYYDAEGNYATA